MLSCDDFPEGFWWTCPGRVNARVSVIIMSYSFVLNRPPEILRIHLRDEGLSPEVDLKVLARDTPTFSGSDLKRKSSCL